MKFDVNVNASRKPDVQPRICSHMNFVGGSPDVERALIYLKLVKENCEREKAMLFASKNICMSDSTRLTDGPVIANQQRTLKVKKGTSNTSLSIKGWLNTGLDYDLGKEFSNEAKAIEKKAALENDKAGSALNKELPQKVIFQKKFERINQNLQETYSQYLFPKRPQQFPLLQKRVG